MSSPTRRRVDPHRRRRIIDATLEVVAERGVSGLSHRRVAKVAGVPLSATSYYFGSLDEMLEAAFAEALERDLARTDAGLADPLFATDPVLGLATMLRELILDRAVAVQTTELWTEAVRNERLRPLALAWDERWYELLLAHFDELMARVAVSLTAGIIQRGLVVDPPPSVDEIAVMLRAGLQPALQGP